MDLAPELSFIVPACNEAWIIATTLDAIKQAVTGKYPYEIIVVDNASTDDTRRIAIDRATLVLTRDQGTIGALRNEGVRNARGDILIFLDADVVVTDDWASRLPSAIASLRAQPRLLSGAMCVIPRDASTIERTWFGNRKSDSFSHIGTGHLLTTRAFFDELRGFDESLETGEDANFSRRALRAGGQILPDASLVAEHHGYPRTLKQFIRREAWHGRGDFTSLRAIFASKIALATLLFGAAHAALITALLTDTGSWRNAAVTMIVLICLGSAYFKYPGQGARIILTNAALYYFYYIGRLISLFDRRSRGSQRRGDPRLAA